MRDDPPRLQADQILTGLRRHPRIAFQKLVAGEEQEARLRDSLPPFVPFGDNRYAGFLPVLDWDHRLPSKTVLLRVYGYYSQASLSAGTMELKTRTARIEAQDKFPEFDITDYAGISADEAYDGEIDLELGALSRIRLVSAWRRHIEGSAAAAAVRAARSSPEFRELVAASRGRPDYLGDLEAVSWTPPCESSFDIWTIDCWFLTHLDTQVGKGRSFLVDPASHNVVGVREFVVRSG
jgi:hypothetical protein